MRDIKESYGCPLELSMNLIGGKWKLLILWHLRDKVLRFGELRKMLNGITQKMLTQQLRELEDTGLVIRKVYPVVPPKTEYYLTERSKALIPALNDLCTWSYEYANENNIELQCNR